MDPSNEKAKKIYSEFIVEESPRQVNIAHEKLKSIQSYISQGQATPSMFDSAQLEIVQTLDGDLFKKFLVSPEFEKYLQESTISSECARCAKLLSGNGVLKNQSLVCLKCSYETVDGSTSPPKLVSQSQPTPKTRTPSSNSLEAPDSPNATASKILIKINVVTTSQSVSLDVSGMDTVQSFIQQHMDFVPQSERNKPLCLLVKGNRK